MAEREAERQEEKKEVAESAAVAAATASWPQTRAVLRLIFIVLAVAATIWAIYLLEGVLLLVVLSVFFAYLIAPLVEFFRRPINLRGRERLMPRVAAIAIVYVLIFGSLGLALYLLLPQVGEQFTELGRKAPGYYRGLSERAQSLERFYQRLPPPARDSVRETVGQTVTTLGNYVQATAVQTATFALTHGVWLVLIPILAFFLLKDADSFRRSALRMLPRGRLRWRGDEFFQDVNSALAAYIRAQLIACLLIGVLCTVGFMLLGVPYALVLGILAGVLEFIPLAGPLTVGVIATLVASFYSFGTAVGTLIFLVVLRIVHDYVTYPRIIGSGIHLHPLAVILAILSGAELAGVAGIFLAIPVVAIVSVTYRHWMEHRGKDEGLVATLLQPAEEAVTAPPAQEGGAAAQDESETARNETAKYEAAGGDAKYDVNEAAGEDEPEDEKVVR
jgi:predicted PurR-regulated permease PerM